MIVVVTEDFEVYHDVVSELRERDLAFTTVEPGNPLPAETSVVVTGPGDGAEVAGWPELEAEPPVVEADPGVPREAIEEAVRLLRGGAGRRVIGVDPGEKPGIAVLDGDVVVATFQVPPEEVPSVVRREAADAEDPLVRIGDGARLIGAKIVEEIDDVPVELVDETGTTPYLGEGTRGVGDVLAAVNIARRKGDPVDSREVQPTAGELQRIQERSREASAENWTIGTDLARKVAQGDLTIAEALDAHRADE